MNYLTFTRTYINHGVFAHANGYAVGRSLHANRQLTTSPGKPVCKRPTYPASRVMFRV